MIKPEDSFAALARALKPEQLNLMTATTKEQFDEAFAVIVSQAVSDMERSSNNLAALKEEGLSDVLAKTINGTNILQVRREENSNGHVDLTFDAPLCNPPRMALGEAKIYDGYEWHKKGVAQLVERYSTGRYERGLVIAFIKKKGVKNLMEKLRKNFNELLPCLQIGDCEDSTVKWSFLSKHGHDSGEELEVWHLGCNLYHAAATQGEGLDNGSDE